MTERRFIDLCLRFPDSLVECDADGTLHLLPPVNPQEGARTAEVVADLHNWSSRTGRGSVVGFDVGFLFPSGARRSPDAAWFDRGRWRAAKVPGLRFPVFAPEFVIELRSPTGRVSVLRSKMEDYMKDGVLLGWLIDPKMRTVSVYRPDRAPEHLENPSQVAGEGPVAGFVLALGEIFR